MRRAGADLPPSQRVVVTGMGVVAPNGNTLSDFALALRKGQSGVRHVQELADLGFRCQVAGLPQGVEAIAESLLPPPELSSLNSVQRYACVAALDAWQDAGLDRPDRSDPRIDWETGVAFGTGVGGIDSIARMVPLVDSGRVKRLGGTAVVQSMASAVSARTAGLLALGGQVTTNSSACSTGTEAVVEGLRRIRSGRERRVLCGSAEGASRYTWGGFDAMRVLCARFNERPAEASRPLSASAAGLVPGAGAAALVLESLESASLRGARIHAEILGGWVNAGGQRCGGSLTAPNPDGMVRCIRAALRDAGVAPGELDLIGGHLTGTGADPTEVHAWARALELSADALPQLASTKSLIGHTLGAAGSIELVACVCMLAGRFVHPALNCEDLHPEVDAFAGSIPHEARALPDSPVAIKASFGFGDVNACVVLRAWDGDAAQPARAA